MNLFFSIVFMKREAEGLYGQKFPCVPKSKMLNDLTFTHEESPCGFDLLRIWMCALLFCSDDVSSEEGGEVIYKFMQSPLPFLFAIKEIGSLLL